MAAARFCPQCGIQTIPKANFCTECGATLSAKGSKGGGEKGKKPTAPAASVERRLPVPGLVVLSLYLVVGIGLWVFVLQTERFAPRADSSPASTSRPASTGGSALPQDHPQIALPEEVTTRIVELVAQANAAPQDPEAWRTLAEVQFRASQIDASYRSAALASYSRLSELAPDNLDALRGLGNVYYDLEEYPKAIDHYQRYLTLKPDDPGTQTDLGTMYLYTGQVDQAISSYQDVLEMQPNFFQAHFNLGIAYQDKGLLEQARASFHKAKTLTDNANIRTLIDQILAQFRNGASAAQTAPPTSSATPPFQQAVESLFLTHEMMAPKIVRIEWPSQTEAKVFFRHFPMAGMPPTVREGFRKKLHSQITDAQQKNGVSGQVTVELVDIDTQQVMETITTTTS